nr:reverse transcriptase domain-containing protein [Tanacetum cinerariifolium]
MAGPVEGGGPEGTDDREETPPPLTKEQIEISSFIDAVKSPELAKHFSNKVPTTVNEMMDRLDDFVRSEEAYARTELSRGEVGEAHRKTSLVFNRRDIRSPRNAHPGESRRSEYRNNYRGVKDAYLMNRTRDDRPYIPLQRESIATEFLQYSLSRIFDQTSEGNLSHRNTATFFSSTSHVEPVKVRKHRLDVRKKGRGPQGRGAPQPEKVINVISVNSVKDKKWKGREVTESWINIPISFPAISSKDIFEEPLIVEAKVEGYLVKRVYVDEGSSVEVMFEHCFENLDSRIKAKLKETQTDLVGFAGEIPKPLGKI